MPRPFIKWAGGKSQLLHELVKHVPEFDTYFEPFLGGAALFFSKQPKKAVLADVNGELINTYKVVRDSVDDLLSLLQQEVNTLEEFNRIKALDPKVMTSLERAVRFIYLNKTAFNGLYRVNSRGMFNTPFGKYTKPNIADANTLQGCSRALQGIDLFAQSFETTLASAKSSDFVYLDPPYMPVKSDSFTAYSKKGFGLKDHESLAKLFEDLDSKGVKVLLSNSDMDWVRERYGKFKVIEVLGRRSISCKGDGRASVGELLVKNY